MKIHPRLLANARQRQERLQQVLLSERDTAVNHITVALAGFEQFGQDLDYPWLADLTDKLDKLREELADIEPASPPSSKEAALLVARMQLLQIAVDRAVDLIRSNSKPTGP